MSQGALFTIFFHIVQMLDYAQVVVNLSKSKEQPTYSIPKDLSIQTLVFHSSLKIQGK